MSRFRRSALLRALGGGVLLLAAGTARAAGTWRRTGGRRRGGRRSRGASFLPRFRFGWGQQCPRLTLPKRLAESLTLPGRAKLLLSLLSLALAAGTARAAGTWYEEVGSAAPWSARSGHTSLVFNAKIWVIGGSDPAGYKSDVWFSPDGVNWTADSVVVSE